jgi:hypothetical protein
MTPMKVEIYPTLDVALKNLEKGEALKTSSVAIMSPIKVRYERTPRGYENIEIDVAKTGYYDESVFYECLTFRRGKLEEIIESLNYLVELAERKRNLFERPLKELITEGIKEIGSLEREKEFICLGEVRLEAEYVIGWELRVQDYRAKLLKTMEESDWKKEILYDELEKIIERKIKRTDIHIAMDGKTKISIVDKEIGEKVKRVVADYWEKEKILGLDGSGDDKVMLNKILSEVERKFGKKYLEGMFPNVIGNITLHSKDLESVVFIPITIEKEQSREVVRFLPLAKQKVEAGFFEWSVVGKNEDLEAEISSSYIPIMLIDQEEVPKEIMDTAKKEGKKTILISSEIEEEFKVIRKYSGNRKFRDKDQEASIDIVYYTAKIEDLVRALVIDIEEDGTTTVFIKRLNEKKGRVKDEEIYISIIMRHSLYHLIKSVKGTKEEKRAKGLGLLGRLIADSIEGEIEKMVEEMKGKHNYTKNGKIFVRKDFRNFE